MKTLLIALATLLSTQTFASENCDYFAENAMNKFQPELESFFLNKRGVQPGDILEIKQVSLKEGHNLASSVSFYAVAAITTPIWLPILISEELRKYDYQCSMKCSLTSNKFKGKFEVTYLNDAGKKCLQPVIYKAKGHFLSQITDRDSVVKTIIKTKIAPTCEQ